MATGQPTTKWDIKPEYANVYEIGQRVDLIVLEDGKPSTYGSHIEDLDDKKMAVSGRTYKSANMPVPIGSEIAVSSFVGGARYMGSGKVLKSHVGLLDLPVLARPTSVRRVQLRSSFRLDIGITDCTMHVLPSADSKVRYELDAEITNLSAGGARIKLEKKVPTSAVAPTVKYFLEFQLDLEGPLGDRKNGLDDSEKDEYGAKRATPDSHSVPCSIIAVDEVGEGKKAHFVGRCAFIDPSAHLQDQITWFVNQGQMALKRRRLY